MSKSPTGPGAPRVPQRWVQDVLEDVFGGAAGPVERIRLLRDGPKQLALVRLENGRDLALKQYADERGYWTRAFTQRLTDREFGPASLLGVTAVHG